MDKSRYFPLSELEKFTTEKWRLISLLLLVTFLNGEQNALAQATETEVPSPQICAVEEDRILMEVIDGVEVAKIFNIPVQPTGNPEDDTIWKAKKKIVQLRCEGLPEVLEFELLQYQLRQTMLFGEEDFEKWETAAAEFDSIKIINYTDSDSTGNNVLYGVLEESYMHGEKRVVAHANGLMNCNAFLLRRLGGLGLVEGMFDLVANTDWDTGSFLHTLAEKKMTNIYKKGSFEGFDQTQLLEHDLVFFFKKVAPLHSHSAQFLRLNENGEAIFISKFGNNFVVEGTLEDIFYFYQKYYDVELIELSRPDTPIRLTDAREYLMEALPYFVIVPKSLGSPPTHSARTLPA